MQVGAAHQNALCVVGLVIDLELVGRQLCQPNGEMAFMVLMVYIMADNPL